MTIIPPPVAINLISNLKGAALSVRNMNGNTNVRICESFTICISRRHGNSVDNTTNTPFRNALHLPSTL